MIQIMNFSRLWMLLVVLSAASCFQVRAQSAYALKGDKVIIEGTSNIHDWECDVEQVSGQASLEMNNGTLTGISALQANFEVKSIKSGKSGMDSNTYKALKADRHPQIQYTLTRVQSITPKGGAYTVKASGNLDIAGKTQPVTLAVTVRADEKGVLSISGEKTLNMTDYAIEPPTAMFGTIKTGEEVTLKFTVNLTPDKASTR